MAVRFSPSPSPMNNAYQQNVAALAQFGSDLDAVTQALLNRVERLRIVSAAGNVSGGFAVAGEDGDDGWIDRDEILQVAKEKEKELMVEMINFPKKNSLIR
ncbi:hypothetical protein L6452_18005 [Arctium lappa]|uniref:Uncharacterized protein n=1 Tax=Arctium lappa TaxID=4217 RepID=A0ACB9C4X6_ARCLA|nr:hypothetical protein L6452_18005 [Arctium lappa]